MKSDLDSIAAGLDDVTARIAAAAARAGRSSGDVSLVAVSKTHPPAAIVRYALLCAQRGRKIFLGESYVQEFKRKRAILDGQFRGDPAGARWLAQLSAHYIGNLQRNKVRDAVQLFDLIETVHSPEIAASINKEAARAGKVQRILFQINVSADPRKSGFSPADIADFLTETESHPAEFTALAVEGLMTITQAYATAELARADFRALRELRDRLPARCRGFGAYALRDLSMGMSQDYEVAIEEGATLVRIGTALFGVRESVEQSSPDEGA